MSMHYFDYAAATPLSDTVKVAMEQYLSTLFYNPSAQYLQAKHVHSALEQARAQVAKVLGAKPQEIIFTAGGTEANNLAITGIMQHYKEANCIVSAVEHDAVLKPAERSDYKIAPVDSYGRVDIDALKKLIDDDTVLISIMYANNEIGTVQPLASIAKVISEVKWHRTKKGNTLPLYFHTDACQAPNYLHTLVNTLGVDLMTLNAGKIYGPKQVGALYANRDVHLLSQIVGGGQEKNMRSGTENVSGIIGFATALAETAELRESESARMQELFKTAKDFIETEIPNATIQGSLAYRLPNNVHIRIPGVDNELLMMSLDERGFMVAVGSACSASSDEPSHVLRAIGLSDEEARSSLRITMGRQTKKADLLALLAEIKKLTSDR